MRNFLKKQVSSDEDILRVDEDPEEENTEELGIGTLRVDEDQRMKRLIEKLEIETLQVHEEKYNEKISQPEEKIKPKIVTK